MYNYNYNVEIILYTCPDFVIDNDYHRGTFGMIVRFFPIFNFKNNDANYVFISDLDIQEHDIVYYKNILDLLKTNNLKDRLNFFYTGYKYFRANYWYKTPKMLNEKKILPFYASLRLMSFKRLDGSSLLEYINNFKKYRSDIYFIYSRSEGSESKIKNSNDEYIFYGWDEYYLNSLFIDKNLNLPFGCNYSNSVVGNIYAIYDRINNRKEFWREKYLTRFFKFIFGYFDNLKNCIIKIKNIFERNNVFLNIYEKNMKELDKLTKSQINIGFRILKFYIINYNDDKLKDVFFEDFINLILSDYYLGKIYYKETKIYNTDEDAIEFEYIELPKEKVESLKRLKVDNNVAKVLF